MAKRIAVIGAGPSGLAQLRAFDSDSKKNGTKVEIVCFEKQEDWGGMWNYTWKTGVDEFGEPVHCSMYRYLWSNGPKECLEFADYSFEEHFGKPIASFPPRAVLWDYIKGRIEKLGIRNQIRFRSPVRAVSYSDATEKFTVTVHDLIKDHVYSEEFDYVVVASGHFSFPNMVQFDGFDTFNGRILHAHDFRDALEFKDKNILIVGTSYSAEDIGSQCYKYGAKSITISHRTKAMGFHWPSNWKEVPLLTSVKHNTAYFKDGTSTEVDAIILCTGYRHHFPFLPDSLRLITNNRLWPLGLYKGIFWEPNPKLIYLGMQDQYYTFNMFDAQAWYARDFILDRIQLPSLGEMKSDSLAWRQREEGIKDPKEAVVFQGDYVKDLLSKTDYPKLDVEGINQTMFQWKEHKKEDIMGFRDRAFRSLITGTQSPVYHTPWMEVMDDSLESYLSEPKPKKEQLTPRSLSTAGAGPQAKGVLSSS